MHTHAAASGRARHVCFCVKKPGGESGEGGRARARARERAFARVRAHHQENIINGNRSRIWLGLTPVAGVARGDETPTSNSSGLSDRMSFPTGLRDALGRLARFEVEARARARALRCPFGKSRTAMEESLRAYRQ